jgi:glycosidase
MLWLSNKNPAFRPFQELFDETNLQPAQTYNVVTAQLRDYFATRPQADPEYPNLIDMMRAPALVSPDSLGGQLEFVRRKWSARIGNIVRKLMLAADVLKEEDVAIWMRFHPPSEAAGAARRRRDQSNAPRDHRGEVLEFSSQQQEYERFSPDQDWMPNTVLIAKSTYVWLDQLSKRYGRHIHRLDQIPDEELSTLAHRGFNALWLIGVWERSRASQTIKRLCGNAEAVASAYSLYDYAIAADLGGEHAYRNLRDRAAYRGIRLASDMVPNHMGIDSRWVIEHPEWFLSRNDSPYPAYRFEGPDLSNDGRVEIKIEDHYYEQSDAAVVFRRRDKWTGSEQYVYHGNDGTSFPWNDTAQLNYLSAQVREQVIQTILHVARLFPIIRFDAAMTLAKRHIQRLWFPAPGAGGAIPSRAEYSMTQAEFDAAIPHEFWREVVDRVAVEVPGTLLLAEAFWLMEGYFVRTLGMHRVYNSAFMVMMRDEDNAKYRSVLKNTMEFDPGIMKRYVNFMSNPDERTAVDQFGSDDKYFGVASLMATLPGLPMFGHGQVEGFTEKYGMEYYRPRYDETPNHWLVERHQREIAPLLHQRRLFAESEHFLLYDFWRPDGGVDENVFAYSNRNDDQRALVLFNNSYGSTSGTIHHSTNFAHKESGSLRQRDLRDGLGLTADGDAFIAYRNISSGLEYIRRASDLAFNGFTIELRGYQYCVLLNWRELRSDAQHPWAALHDQLRGNGVPSLEEAFVDLRMKPVHDALYALLEPTLLRSLADESQKFAATLKTAPVTPKSRVAEPIVGELVRRTRVLLDQSRKILGIASPSKAEKHRSETDLNSLYLGLLRLPSLESAFPKPWPESAREVFGSSSPRKNAGAIVAPALAAVALGWVLLQLESTHQDEKLNAFERLHLRKVLANSFQAMQVEGEDSWRVAARLRLLLANEPENTVAAVASTSVLQKLVALMDSDPEVRWLTGVHGAGSTTYFIKEPFEQLMWWLQLPRLIESASSPNPDKKSLARIAGEVQAGCVAAAKAGYDVEKLQKEIRPPAAKAVVPSLKVKAPAKPGGKAGSAASVASVNTNGVGPAGKAAKAMIPVLAAESDSAKRKPPLKKAADKGKKAKSKPGK